MNPIKTRFKKRFIMRSSQAEDTVNGYIQPFKQMPCVGDKTPECVARINAHDLFSHYTVEIIKEDVVYAR
jgi:hypothetical protein